MRASRSVVLLNRTVAARRDAGEAFRFAGRRPAGSTGLAEATSEADLIVNATSAGLHDGDGVGRAMGSGQTQAPIVTDLVYVPLITPVPSGRAAKMA